MLAAAAAPNPYGWNYRPHPSMYYRPNPIGTGAKIAIGVAGVALVSYGIYYYVAVYRPMKALRNAAAELQEAAANMPAPPPPRPSGPDESSAPSAPSGAAASSSSLGIWTVGDLEAQPDPVIFVLLPGESFDIDFGAPVGGRFAPDPASGPDTSALQLASVSLSGEMSSDPISELKSPILRVTAPQGWGPQSAGSLVLVVSAGTKRIWIMGA